MTAPRPTGDSTVLTAWTGTLLRALDAHGVDASRLAAEVGVPADLLEDPDRRIPLALSTRLWHAAVAEVGDDAFGIDVSRHVRPGSFHALGHVFLSSPTLQDALERAARFSRVTSDVAAVSTFVDGADLCLAIDLPTGLDHPAHEAIDAIVASIVRAARFLLDREAGPAHVDLERPRPRNLERFDGFFRCPLTFDATTTVLAFDRALAARPIPGGSGILASTGERAISAYLDHLAPATASQEVAAVLADALVAGEPGIGAVAAALATSPRSLQRRLASEGTTYREVLAATRRELADALLAAGTPVTTTALRLGFSETAAFSRAYRRWTGVSPSAARPGR